MANWRSLALQALLADGKIDDAECKILRKALWQDNKIDAEEVKFLVELRNQAQKKAKAKKAKVNAKFEKLFFEAIQANVLKDGKIDAGEAAWLRTMLFADKKIDAGERAFMKKLKKEAKQTSPEFDALYTECVATKSAAPKKKKAK